MSPPLPNTTINITPNDQVVKTRNNNLTTETSNKSCYRLYAGHGNWINLNQKTTQDLLEIFKKGQPCRYELFEGLYIDIIPHDVDCNSKNIDMFGLMRADLVYQATEEQEQQDQQQVLSRYIKSLLEEQGIIDAFPPPSRDQNLPIITNIPTHRHLSLVPAVLGATRRGPKLSSSSSSTYQQLATIRSKTTLSSRSSSISTSGSSSFLGDSGGGGGGGGGGDVSSTTAITANNLILLSNSTTSTSSSNSTSPHTSRSSNNMSSKRTMNTRRNIMKRKNNNSNLVDLAAAAAASAVATKRHHRLSAASTTNDLLPAISISNTVQLYDQHHYLNEQQPTHDGYSVNPSMLPIHFHHPNHNNDQQHWMQPYQHNESSCHHHQHQQFNFEFGQMDFDPSVNQGQAAAAARQSPTDILDEYDNPFHHHPYDPTTLNHQHQPEQSHYVPSLSQTNTTQHWRNNWSKATASSSMDSSSVHNNTNEDEQQQQHYLSRNNNNESSIVEVVTTLPMERLLFASSQANNGGGGNTSP